MNRFSTDMSDIDGRLPQLLQILVKIVMQLTGSILLTCISLPWFSAMLIPLALVYYWIQLIYRYNNWLLLKYTSRILIYFSTDLSTTLSVALSTAPSISLVSALQISLHIDLTTDVISTYQQIYRSIHISRDLSTKLSTDQLIIKSLYRSI